MKWFNIVLLDKCEITTAISGFLQMFRVRLGKVFYLKLHSKRRKTMKTLKKLSLRLLVLAALVGGVFFVQSDNVSANGIACDFIFQDCMNSCEQGNGGCYATCYIAYTRCLEEPIID
jgi:hypothetical protein